MPLSQQQASSQPSLMTGGSPMAFTVLAVTFCICLVVANLLEIKTVDLGFMTITAGVVVFPVSYIVNDLLVELYGMRRASAVIFLGFLMNLLTVGLVQLAIALPGSPEWEGQQAMESMFGATPRILLASFTAFLAGSLGNALVMDRMRRRHGSGRRFGLRAMASTVVGEGVDSAIFFPIAFGGVLAPEVILTLILTQTILKTAYEATVLPLTTLIMKRLLRTRLTSPIPATA